MNSHLISCERLDIPEALALDHQELRADLIKAALKPGRTGIAAKKLAHLYLPHFAKEEQFIFSAFGLLLDLEAKRVEPDRAPVAPMVALFSAQHHSLLGRHLSINAALEDLLGEAQREGCTEIDALVSRLRNHEKAEDQVMFPTVLLIGKTVRDGLGMEPLTG